MNIPTLEDFKKIEAKLDILMLAVGRLHEAKISVLTSEDILIRLKISYRTFQNRLPTLKRHGLFKEGGAWKMQTADFDNYIKALR